MTANSLLARLPGVINEISLITGLKAPVIVDDTGKEDHKPFAKEFSRFIVEHYGLLTCAEIPLAFRLHAAGELEERIEFYGTTLTIEHVGRVLFRYIRKRAALAKKLSDQRKEPKELPPPSPKQQEMDDKQFCNEYYRKYLEQEFSAVSLEYSHMVYNMLDKLKMIPYSSAEKNVYMIEAQKIRDKEIAAPTVDRAERAEQNRLIEAYLNDAIPVAEQELVKNYAKRLAVMDLFKAWKEQKRKRIFEI